MNRLLGTNEVFVANSVLSPDEQAVLVEWADEQHGLGQLIANPADRAVFSTRFYRSDGELTPLTGDASRTQPGVGRDLVWIPDLKAPAPDPLPKVFWQVRQRVIDLLGLHSLDEDPYKGSFLSYLIPPGGVHRHRDELLSLGAESVHLLRCNVLFRRPESGGLPMIADREIDVPDRGMWAFYPTALVHEATEARGEVRRGVLSFGFVARPADLRRRCFHLAHEVAAKFGLDRDEQARRRFAGYFRQSAKAAELDPGKFALIEFVLGQSDNFSVDKAALTLNLPPATVESLLEELQHSSFVTSCSSARTAHGKVELF